MRQSVLILLAEDEELIAFSLQEDLIDAGFTVQHVSTGEQAVEELNQRGAELSGVITDIRFGPGIDGWGVARHARELIPNVPVVYMSGDSAHEHTAYGVPESVVLQKPFASVQVITAISTLLNAMPPHQP